MEGSSLSPGSVLFFPTSSCVRTKSARSAHGILDTGVVTCRIIRWPISIAFSGTRPSYLH